MSWKARGGTLRWFSGFVSTDSENYYYSIRWERNYSWIEKTERRKGGVHWSERLEEQSYFVYYNLILTALHYLINIKSFTGILNLSDEPNDQSYLLGVQRLSLEDERRGYDAVQTLISNSYECCSPIGGDFSMSV